MYLKIPSLKLCLSVDQRKLGLFITHDWLVAKYKLCLSIIKDIL